MRLSVKLALIGLLNSCTGETDERPVESEAPLIEAPKKRQFKLDTDTERQLVRDACERLMQENGKEYDRQCKADWGKSAKVECRGRFMPEENKPYVYMQCDVDEKASCPDKRKELNVELEPPAHNPPPSVKTASSQCEAIVYLHAGPEDGARVLVSSPYFFHLGNRTEKTPCSIVGVGPSICGEVDMDSIRTNPAIWLIPSRSNQKFSFSTVRTFGFSNEVKVESELYTVPYLPL